MNPIEALSGGPSTTAFAVWLSIITTLIGTLIGLVVGFFVHVGWEMRFKPSTKPIDVVFPSDGDALTTACLKVQNPEASLGIRQTDADVGALVSVQKINGSPPIEFFGTWFSREIVVEWPLATPGESRVNFRAGDTKYLPLVTKRLNDTQIRLCGYVNAPGISTGTINNNQLDIGAYALSVTLDRTGGEKVYWYSIHNKDRQPANLKVLGPYKSFKEANQAAKKSGIA